MTYRNYPNVMNMEYSSDFKEDVGHVYLDLSAINSNFSGEAQPVPLVFTYNRSQPIIEDTKNYYLTIARFSISGTNTLPAFIPIIDPNNFLLDRTIYSVTLTYNHSGTDFEVQKYVIYQNLHPHKVRPNPFKNNDSYYYIYNYEWVAKLFSNALSDAYDELRTNVNSAGGSLPANQPPYMYYDVSSQLFRMYCPKALYDNSLGNPVKIFFNTATQTIFASFLDIHYGYGTTSPLVQNGKNFQLVVDSNNGVNVETIDSVDYVVCYQNWNTTALMSPVSSIVFQASMIPIIPSLVADPVNRSNENLSNVGSSANISNQITDIEIYVENGYAWKPTVLYVPSLYRYIDLKGSNSFYSISMSVFWKDKFGVLVPFELNTNCNADIKLVFVRKDKATN